MGPRRSLIALPVGLVVVMALVSCSDGDDAASTGTTAANRAATTAPMASSTVPASVDPCELVTDADVAAAGLADAYPGTPHPTVPPLAPEDLADPWAACDRAAADGSGYFLRVEVAGGASATFERAVAEVEGSNEPEPVSGVGDEAAFGDREDWYTGGGNARSLVILVGPHVVRLTLPADRVDDALVELGRAAAGRVGG